LVNWAEQWEGNGSPASTPFFSFLLLFSLFKIEF
jgi:hypothetical protein